MSKLLHNHHKNRKLTTLIENKTNYTAEYSELSIFETYQPADKIKLTFNFPAVISMITGKKIMHFNNFPSFDFIPGQSIVVPSQKELVIDFPDATLKNPTQCTVLTIDPKKIDQITEQFNDQISLDHKNFDLAIDLDPAFLINRQEINMLIHRLVHTFTNNIEQKDLILDLMIQELIVRLLQTHAKHLLLTDFNHSFTDSRIGTAVKYIKEHLTEKNITVESLAKLACMSTSHFYKQFKNTLGVSPVDFINSERIKFSKKLLAENKNNLKVSEVAYLSGFNSISYFTRQFKKHELISPSSYLKALKEQRFHE